MRTGQSVLLQRASVPCSSHKWSNQHPMTESLLDAHLLNQQINNAKMSQDQQYPQYTEI